MPALLRFLYAWILESCRCMCFVMGARVDSFNAPCARDNPWDIWEFLTETNTCISGINFDILNPRSPRLLRILLSLGLSGAKLPSAPPKEFLQSFRPDTFPHPFISHLHQYACPVRLSYSHPIFATTDPLISYLILLSRQGKVVCLVTYPST